MFKSWSALVADDSEADAEDLKCERKSSNATVEESASASLSALMKTGYVVEVHILPGLYT